MKQILTTLLFLLGILLIVRGQSNRFQIGIGYQRTWMLDRQASPLKYQSSEKTILLGYQHEGAKSQFHASLNGSLGNFFPTGFFNRKWYNSSYHPDGTSTQDSSFLRGMLYTGRLQVGYLREVGSGFSTIDGKRLDGRSYAGATLNNQVFYSDNIVRTGWMNSTSLNASYQRDMRYNERHYVFFRISIPLFARNTRLPYHNSLASAEGGGHITTIFRQGSRWAWLGNFQDVQVEAGYDYSIGRHFGMGLRYFGQWLNYRNERPVRLFQNNVSLTATIK
jgi:hypothetical protein